MSGAARDRMIMARVDRGQWARVVALARARSEARPGPAVTATAVLAELLELALAELGERLVDRPPHGRSLRRE